MNNQTSNQASFSLFGNTQTQNNLTNAQQQQQFNNNIFSVQQEPSTSNHITFGSSTAHINSQPQQIHNTNLSNNNSVSFGIPLQTQQQPSSIPIFGSYAPQQPQQPSPFGNYPSQPQQINTNISNQPPIPQSLFRNNVNH